VINAINNAVKMAGYPIIEAPIPAPNASITIAMPSKKPSLAEILPERSRSAYLGNDKTVRNERFGLVFCCTFVKAVFKKFNNEKQSIRIIMIASMLSVILVVMN